MAETVAIWFPQYLSLDDEHEASFSNDEQYGLSSSADESDEVSPHTESPCSSFMSASSFSLESNLEDLSIATQLGDFLADKEDEVKANSRNLASYAKDEVETNSSDHATSEADENKTNPPNNMFLVEEVAIGPPNQMASSEENQVDSFSPNNSPLQKDDDVKKLHLSLNNGRLYKRAEIKIDGLDDLPTCSLSWECVIVPDTISSDMTPTLEKQVKVRRPLKCAVKNNSKFLTSIENQSNSLMCLIAKDEFGRLVAASNFFAFDTNGNEKPVTGESLPVAFGKGLLLFTTTKCCLILQKSDEVNNKSNEKDKPESNDVKKTSGTVACDQFELSTKEPFACHIHGKPITREIQIGKMHEKLRPNEKFIRIFVEALLRQNGLIDKNKKYELPVWGRNAETDQKYWFSNGNSDLMEQQQSEITIKVGRESEKKFVYELHTRDLNVRLPKLWRTKKFAMEDKEPEEWVDLSNPNICFTHMKGFVPSLQKISSIPLPGVTGGLGCLTVEEPYQHQFSSVKSFISAHIHNGCSQQYWAFGGVHILTLLPPKERRQYEEEKTSIQNDLKQSSDQETKQHAKENATSGESKHTSPNCSQSYSNQRRNTMLYWACFYDDLELVVDLIESGISAKSTDQYCLLPLHYAIKNNAKSVVAFFLDMPQFSCLFAQQAENGNSAFMAVCAYHIDVAKMIISKYPYLGKELSSFDISANELLESLDIAFKEETIVNEAPKSHIKKNRKRKLEDETADRPFSKVARLFLDRVFDTPIDINDFSMLTEYRMVDVPQNNSISVRSMKACGFEKSLKVKIGTLEEKSVDEYLILHTFNQTTSTSNRDMITINFEQEITFTLQSEQFPYRDIAVHQLYADTTKEPDAIEQGVELNEKNLTLYFNTEDGDIQFFEFTYKVNECVGRLLFPISFVEN